MAATGSIFVIHTTGEAHVVEFNGPDVIEASEIKHAGDEIYHYLKDLQGVKLVLDFNRVKHLSSAALGMIIALNKVIDQRDGQIRIANVGSEIEKIFKMTKLNKLMQIVDGTQAAIDSFS